MKNEKKKQKSNSSKRRLWVVLIVLFTLLVTMASIVGVLIYKNYVLYPRFDKALGRAIEPKLDLGTKFDIRDMIRQGSTEFIFTDVEGVDKLDGSISYGRGGASVQINADENEIDAILTRDGIALSADGVASGEYYGIGFSQITDNIDGSFLNPENNSEYSLAADKYEALRTLIFQLEDIAANKGEYAEDAKILLRAFSDAHEQSPLYTEEHLHGGMTVNGESRFARGVIYSFDHESLMGYLDALSELFADPTDELRTATERLICGGIIQYELTRLTAMELSQCEDVSKLIYSLGHFFDVFFGKSEWSGKLTVVYVKNALSALELDIEMKKFNIYALADFGADPTKDKNMRFVFARETLDSEGALIKSKEHVMEYNAERQGIQSDAEMTYAVCEEGGDGTLDKEAYVLSVKLDRKNDNAEVVLKKSREYHHPWAAETDGSITERIFDKNLGMKDKYSSISFVASDGTTIALSRYAKKVKMPRAEDILTTSVEEVDMLIDEFCEKYRWFVEYIKKEAE